MRINNRTFGFSLDFSWEWPFISFSKWKVWGRIIGKELVLAKRSARFPS